MTRSSHLPTAATCTFALRLADGRYVTDLAGIAGSYSIDNAYLWLWPIGEAEDARAERVAAVAKRYPWIGRPTVVRARA